MRKSYLLFAFVLVTLILAFSFTRSYLTSLEDSAKKGQNQPVSRTTLDSLEQEIKVRFDEYKAFVDRRLDSIEQRYQQQSPSLGDAAAETEGDYSDSDRQASRRKEAGGDEERAKTPAKSEKSITVPTEEEIAIYQEYLRRRLALPTDLSAYELKVAKNEILIDLGKAHGISDEEVADLVDRVYEYRRKGDRN